MRQSMPGRNGGAGGKRPRPVIADRSAAGEPAKVD